MRWIVVTALDAPTLAAQLTAMPEFAEGLVMHFAATSTLTAALVGIRVPDATDGITPIKVGPGLV